MRLSGSARSTLALLLALCAVLAGGATRIVQDQCGPFTDVTPSFCPYILELYYLGITAGTSATTFSPDDPLTRGQAAVFIAKGLNQSLARSSRRAALGQWWTTTPHYIPELLGLTHVGVQPLAVASDGADLWVANGDGTVSRVRASDGRLLETWTGVPTAQTVLVAMGRVFALTGGLDGGSLYMIDPSQPPGDATLVANIGNGAARMAFDGNRILVSNGGGIQHDVYLSIVTPGATLPWSAQKIHNPDHSLAGFFIFDGTSMWLANFGGELLRLDDNGAVTQAVALGTSLRGGAYDGSNLWIPDTSNVLYVVQATTGTPVAALTGNGLDGPFSAAFDGERILVTNPYFGDSVSLWRAADLAPLGSFSTGVSTTPFGACSDGVNFWIALSGRQHLARF